MTPDEIKTTLAQNGYCIVPNILTPDEIEYCKNEFKTWQQTIPNHDEVHRIINPHGIYKYHCAGHTRHAWFIRTRPSVQQVFKDLWETDELIVSFDGCCYISKDTKTKDRCWTHTDQAPDKVGLKCYQGFVSLTENKERTLVVYEKTHLDHQAYFEDRDVDQSNDWQVLDKSFVDSISDKKHALHVPAGALVLWDSRIFHQNQYGAPESEERMVQYVCYLPKSHEKNTQAMIDKRARYLLNRRTTSHWPVPIRTVGLQPQMYGDKSREIDYSQIPTTYLADLADEIVALVI